VGGITGGISTAIYGGNFGQNLGYGVLSGAVMAAAVYGGYKLWGILTGLPRAPASEIRPELETIANDPAIRPEIDRAWADSNPSGSPTAKQEQGFWILRDSKTQALSVQNFPPGGRDFMIPGPTPDGAAAFFHTHPNTVAEGYLQGPSAADARFATSRGIPGIIRSHDGMYYFGPPLR
jgi:hypothetical protein